MITHAAVIPLAGGNAIGAEQAIGKPPEYALSWSAFGNNDQWYRDYRPDVSYINLDDTPSCFRPKQVDIVTTVCPCAGLSNHTSRYQDEGGNPAYNDWMPTSTKYILEHIKPRVLIGENAYALGTKKGEPILRNLLQIAESEGYSMRLYLTDSREHGLPQRRTRTWYMFFDGPLPEVDFIHRQPPGFDEYLAKCNIPAIQPEDGSNMGNLMAKTHFTHEMKPTDHPSVRYLQRVKGFSTEWPEFVARCRAEGYVNKCLSKVIVQARETEEFRDFIMNDSGPFHFSREKELKIADDLVAIQQRGTLPMTRQPIIPGASYTPPIVLMMRRWLCHPTEERFLNIGELLHLMNAPDDMRPRVTTDENNINILCQNVSPGVSADFVEIAKQYVLGNLPSTNLFFELRDNIRKEVRETAMWQYDLFA